MQVASVRANNVTNALSHARRLLGVSLKGHREVERDYQGGDGLYLVKLESGHTVEVTVAPGATAEGYVN